MRNKWPLVIVIGGLVLWSMRGKIAEASPMPTSTVPSYMKGVVPSGTPVDSAGNVLLRDKYTKITEWIPYADVDYFLARDWVYA